MYFLQRPLVYCVSNLKRLYFHKLYTLKMKSYFSMFPLLLMPVLRWKRQWHLRSAEQEPFTNISGVKGSQGHPGHRHAEHTGAPRAAIHHISICHDYIHKYRHTCLEKCNHTYCTGDDTHLGVTHPLVLFSALACIRSDIVGSWECVTSNCENVGLCDRIPVGPNKSCYY